MKLLPMIGLIILLTSGCSITIIHYGDREPYDHTSKGDWDTSGTDDSTAVAVPDGGTTGSETATAKPNPELKQKLVEQLKALQPIFTKEYKQLLTSKPNLAGTVVMRVTISGEGKIKDVNVISNTTGDDRLAASLEKEIRSFKLDTGTKMPSDVVFDVPFKFAEGVGEVVGVE